MTCESANSKFQSVSLLSRAYLCVTRSKFAVRIRYFISMAALAEDIIVENEEQGQQQQQKQLQNQAHLVNGMSPSRTNRPAPSLANGSTTVISAADYTSIPKLYADRSVFITGGTGFMGKVLVEKLLRSCPGIKNIYLLIRPKKGQETAARLNDLLNAPVKFVIQRFPIYPYKSFVSILPAV